MYCISLLIASVNKKYQNEYINLYKIIINLTF